MYLFLNIINQLLNTILYTLLASFLLTPRYSRIKSISIFTFFVLFMVIYKFSFYSNLTAKLIASVFFQASLYMFIIIVFKESLFKKMLACVSTITPALMSEYTALMLNNKLFGANYDALHPDSKEFFIVTTIALFSQLIMSVFIIFIWRAISHKKNSSNLFYFTIMPAIQFFLIVAIFAPFIFGGTALNPIALSICITISLISCIILFYYTLRRNEKRTIQVAYEELEKLYSLDLEYYKELESKHEELAKLRHDYQNHLATLYMLISSGKTDAAKEFADSLKNSLYENKSSSKG